MSDLQPVARALVERLRAALPQAEVALAPGEAISLDLGGRAVQVGFGLLASSGRAEDLETAARAVLSAAQDLASEASTEPWPGRWGTGPALPDARVAGGALRAWFGPEERPLLALEPITLS